jgi:hypothetical protein
MSQQQTSPPPPPPPSAADDIDYRHRHLVNLLAVILLLLVAIAVVWTIKAMEDNENLRKCVAAGRRDCGTLGIIQPPRNVVIINH